MKLKKLTIISILLITTMLLITGCSFYTKKSYTFDVETGDKIKIEMTTTGGYNMTSELPIEFSKDDEVISQGSFLKEEAYDYYVENVEDNYDAEVIEKKSKDNIEYIFYSYDDGQSSKIQYNYIVKIKKSNTCFALGNNKSEKSARDIFEKLKFSVEK